MFQIGCKVLAVRYQLAPATDNTHFVLTNGHPECPDFDNIVNLKNTHTK